MGTPKSNLQLWIDLAKWFFTSVVVVVATMIINWGFNDRKAGLAELKFYDNYVTDIVIKNANPVQRRMLAQYVACVTPSEKLREGWKIYYDSIYPEYIKYITPIVKEDSILQGRYLELLDSSDNKDISQLEINNLKSRLDEIHQILYPEIKLPEPEDITIDPQK
ncbi:MAG: hypothetical protein IH596_09695 [Bacteroidales bacterium]|nr:hypothetical protein [Bacteroidales bacterium]